jgi:glycosyltransferase involved in cell wall biosynthesis/peptidoglycan/xylan/chitin deacetylase (PgdA/CDA1 family)
MMWNPGIGSLIGDRGRYDIWLVNTCYTSATTQHAVACLRRQRVPWVYMNEPPRPRRGLKGWLQRVGLHPVLASADGYIGMGRETARRYSVLQQRLGRRKTTISVPYYVDVQPFFDLPPPAVQAVVRFLCVAQLVKRKGLDTLLSACRTLPRKGWELHVYGNGPLRGELLREAAGLPAVQFSGIVPYERRTAAFEGQHVFVLPSRWDGFGMVIPEALAAGLPVITTDHVMSASDFVRDGVNGFICPVDRADCLAERMRWFLENPHRIGVMSQAARDGLSAYRPELGAAELAAFLHQTAKDRLDGAAPPAQPTWLELSPDRPPAVKARRAVRRAALTVLSTLSSLRRRRPGHRILVYHLVLAEDRDRFRDHLRLLKDHFVIGRLEQLAAPESMPAPNGDLAILTFDDGFAALMKDCVELLAEEGVPATFFIPSGFIELADHPEAAAYFSRMRHHYPRPLAPMTPDHLRELVLAGHAIGSHMVTHTSIRDLAPQRAQNELAQSKRCLEAWSGRPVSALAYPYGHVDHPQADPVPWVAAAGYTLSVTLQRGRVTAVTDRLRLPRNHVEGSWPLADLVYFLSR